MKADKNYCMSSYLAFRYVYDEERCFKEGILHHDHKLVKNEEKIPCKTATDIDESIKNVLAQVNLSDAALFFERRNGLCYTGFLYAGRDKSVYSEMYWKKRRG